MTAALLSDLSAAGVTVRIDAAGLLKASGDKAALERLLPEILLHKTELLALLAANDPEPVKTSRLFLVTRPNGEQFSLSRNPPATLAEIRADYPDSRIEPMPNPPPAPSLSGENLQLAYAVLRAWQEDDTATGLEWIDGLARDPAMLAQMHEQAVALGLARWEDVPTPASAPVPSAQPETPRPTATCARCRHFERDPINPRGGFGKCLISAPASRKAGSCWPWPDAELHCNEFEVNP